MSKPKKRKTKSNRESFWESPRLAGLLQLALGLWLLVSLLGATPPWWNVLRREEGLAPMTLQNLGGPVGAAAAFGLRALFGSVWAWAAAGWMAVRGGLLMARGAAPWLPWPDRVVLLLVATCAWIAQPGGVISQADAAAYGGAPAFYLARGVQALFGSGGGLIFLTAFLIVSVALVFRTWLLPVAEAFARGLRELGSMLAGVFDAVAARPLGGLWRGLRGAGGGSRPAAKPRVRAAAAAGTDEDPDESRDEIVADDPEPGPVPRRVHQKQAPAQPPSVADGPHAEDPAEEPVQATTRATRGGGSVSTLVRGEGDGDFPEVDGALLTQPGQDIPLPGLDLLNDPPPDVGDVSEESLNASADMLEGTLKSFGVDGAVRDVRPGPVVTTFEYQPGSGVKVNAIVQRTDDLALAMEARSIRMEAPIPGKAAVGIEIPNPQAQIVSMKEVMTLAEDRLDKPLSVVLGKDVFGEAVCIDLAEQPHLLVAGSTGSGKSVCVNTMICSMLLRCDPSLVRLLLIDPKMLELNVYNDIPHLLLPVVTDPKQSLRALKWMEAQMDHRYRRLSKHGVRNIEGYNRKIEAGQVLDDEGDPVCEPMPYYVCIVDELADLMVQLGQEIEIPITRIAQKARAVGIHLVLATQRPSVDVLTGVIKANIPCRIAFRVIQKNDSRTILDANGAEKLLGRGDMLYLQPGRALPVRVHGAFVDIEECEAIADHWRQYQDTTRPITLTEEVAGPTAGDLEQDELFERAREVIVMAQHGSTSMLQRKLQVGYARAGRLMDLLEHAGVVGPFIGSKAREVLMKPQDLEALREAERGDDEP